MLHIIRYGVIFFLGFMTGCSETESQVEEAPNCQATVKQVLEQLKNRDETYFKKPINADQLSVIKQSSDILICRGIATLSDNKKIPMHFEARFNNHHWSYSSRRGASIK